MNIPFRTITAQSKEIVYQLKGDGFNVSLQGDMTKKSPHIVELDIHIKGSVEIQCDTCAESYDEEIDDKVTLLITDTQYKNGASDNDEKNYDIIEALDGIIDIDEIVNSEINIFKYDYHKCINCK